MSEGDVVVAACEDMVRKALRELQTAWQSERDGLRATIARVGRLEPRPDDGDPHNAGWNAALDQVAAALGVECDCGVAGEFPDCWPESGTACTCRCHRGRGGIGALRADLTQTRMARLRAFAEWLAGMSDPGSEARRTVTLDLIIRKADEALADEVIPSDIPARSEPSGGESRAGMPEWGVRNIATGRVKLGRDEADCREMHARWIDPQLSEVVRRSAGGSWEPAP